MPAAPRTLKVDAPPMRGEDVKNWQHEVKDQFSNMSIDCPIVDDGIWGISSRGFTASLCHTLGMDAGKVMKDGVTPELRTRIRHRDLTIVEKDEMSNRVEYRRALRKRWNDAFIRVHRPMAVVITDDWGYHPGVHDGIDVQTHPNAPLFAMVKCRIIDARSGGWWGKNPSGEVAKGDGIVQMEVLETVGPFKQGHHIGYGHCEHATVDVGDTVTAGDMVARCGKAVTWHIHLMMNRGETDRGTGSYDPRACLDYAIKHG